MILVRSYRLHPAADGLIWTEVWLSRLFERCNKETCDFGAHGLRVMARGKFCALVFHRFEYQWMFSLQHH